jgi:hypothetical protein
MGQDDTDQGLRVGHAGRLEGKGEPRPCGSHHSTHGTTARERF